MAEGYTVDTGKLGAHQQEVAQAAATGNQVVDAGNQVTPAGWDNAYGLMFQMFPQLTRPIAEKMISFVGDGVRALQQTADAVGDAAKEYENIEQHVVSALRDLQKQLDDQPPVQAGGGALPAVLREPQPPATGPGDDGEGA